MNSISQDELTHEHDSYRMRIEDGCLFIHPTDTIYGLGCDATNKQSVKKLRDVKNRHEEPFSIIAPGKNWILDNCEINDQVRSWLDELPGPYTLILKLKNKNCIAANVNFDLDSIGVRIPNHWFSGFVEKLGVPLVTTTANKIGGTFMTSMETLHEEIANEVDFIVYEDEKQCRPSTLVDLTQPSEILIKR